MTRKLQKRQLDQKCSLKTFKMKLYDKHFSSMDVNPGANN